MQVYGRHRLLGQISLLLKTSKLLMDERLRMGVLADRERFDPARNSATQEDSHLPHHQVC